jgi:tRNA nucleotidyltransferase (CCA-adding enzyme)
MKTWPHVLTLAEAARAAGGRAFLVGGAVRDRLLGRAGKDADVEVHGLNAALVEELAARVGKVHLVGRQFAVLHVATPEGQVEISLPRRESKTGPGHKGFVVSAEPDLGPVEASRRRDFTVNAMLEDPLTGEVLDPWQGRNDIARGILRHVSPAFAEDPLRVLRAGRFAARFNWSVHPATAELCRSLDLAELPRERLEREWREILVNGDYPGQGLRVLEECGALRFFPELAALRGVPQDPVWHPEGDVLTHTALCLDAAVRIRAQMEDPWAEMLGVLCHDLGKATTTVFERGRWRSAGHDDAGADLTISFLARITEQSGLAEQVAAFVREHLRPGQLHMAREKVSEAAIRRLATRVDLRALVRVAWADAAGRGEELPDPWPSSVWLLERAAALGVRDAAPEPFLLGRDALACGLPPGPRVGELMRRAYELQLDGGLGSREAALAWLRTQIS